MSRTWARPPEWGRSEQCRPALTRTCCTAPQPPPRQPTELQAGTDPVPTPARHLRRHFVESTLTALSRWTAGCSSLSCQGVREPEVVCPWNAILAQPTGHNLMGGWQLPWRKNTTALNRTRRVRGRRKLYVFASDACSRSGDQPSIAAISSGRLADVQLLPRRLLENTKSPPAPRRPGYVGLESGTVMSDHQTISIDSFHCRWASFSLLSRSGFRQANE